MYHIVLDFEFTPIPKYYKYQRRLVKHELIEIGAVKLNETYQIIDEFSTFVKPKYSTLDPNCSALTGITEQDLMSAPIFIEAIKAFVKWIGTDEYELYAWSEHDSEQFCGECILNNACDMFPELYNKDWTDLQLLYIDTVGLSKAISLQRALNSLNIFFEGNMHRAADDVYNTASILQSLKNKDEFEKRFAPLQEVLKPNKIHNATLGEILGDKLQILYAIAS